MAFAEHVDKETRLKRYSWLQSIANAAEHPRASYFFSPQGIFITYDIEIAFCAGAWVSVIVLAHAAVDSTIRDTETGEYKTNSKTTFGGDSDLEWLRKKRNSLVHVSEDPAKNAIPESETHKLNIYHDSLEEDAKKAMKLVFKTIYASPGT